MTIVVATNILFAAAIFVAVVGPLVWAIRTQARDELATTSIADTELAEPSRPAAHRSRPRTAVPKLSSSPEVAHS